MSPHHTRVRELIVKAEKADTFHARSALLNEANIIYGKLNSEINELERLATEVLDIYLHFPSKNEDVKEE